ncbi:MAG: PKD domain-containing protein [Vicingaceae bacterium]
MKKLSYLLSLIVALALGNQLNAQCSPYFTDSADSTNLVNFSVVNPQSSSIYTYRWDFGDNSPIDSGATVSHQYNNSGAYGVTLYVDSFGFQCGSRYDTVYVNFCGAYFSSQVNANGLVDFYSSAYHAPYGTTYEWDFGDNSSISTQTNPTHSYSVAGTYYVTHTVIDTFHQVTCSFTDSIEVLGGYQNCNASFTVEKDSSTNFNVIVYNHSSNETSHVYSWDFGDGQSASVRNPNHNYQNFGNYFVCLTITDSIYNCNFTYCDTIGMDSLGNLNKSPGFGLTVKDPLLTSIQENEQSELDVVSIYPNPAKNTISIDLSGIEKAVNLRLMDLSGKIVLSKTNVQAGNVNQLNISTLSDGFYFLSIESENNRKIEKIIKVK